MSNDEGARRFFRTFVLVEVLTEGQPFDGDLSELAYATNDGPAVGNLISANGEEIGPELTAQLLLAMGSEPGFFDLGPDDGEANQ